MTRVTNLGRKRTYVEAGFQSGSVELAAPTADVPSAVEDTGTTSKENVDSSMSDSGPPKKKRKRVRKKKPEPEGGKDAEKPQGQTDREGDDHDKRKEPSLPTKKALKKKRWKELEKQKKQRHLITSEMRRQKRIDERLSGVVCFACREKGHAAKDCPTTRNGSNDGHKVGSRSTVGICYRCGSNRHTLSKCKKDVDDSNPLPFASCFVCKGQGHLVSSCPQNQGKGIYPNGGACKLCGEKTHLAKDCKLRKRDDADTLAVLGTGDRPGADEDDFHTFRRRRQEVEKEIVGQEKKEQALQEKPGARLPTPTKKVVFF